MANFSVGEAGQAVAWHPDANQLVVAERTNLVIFDAELERNVRWVRDFAEKPTAVRFTRSGATLVTGEHGAVRFWEFATGKLLAAVQGFPDFVHVFDLELSPDGARAFIAGSYGWAPVVDLATASISFRCDVGEEEPEFEGAAWTADGQRVAAGEGAKVRIWGAGDGALEGTLDAGQGTVNWIRRTEDPSGLAVVTLNGQLAIVDAERRRVVRGFQIARGHVDSFVTAPDGKSAAVVDQSVRLISLEDGTERWSIPPSALYRPKAAAFSKDGRQLAVVTADGKLGIVDVASGTLREPKA